MADNYKGVERRRFVRLDYITPLAYKVCRQETLSKLLQGYTSDVSQAGVMCRIEEKVNKDDILWLSFDRAALDICEEMEKRCLIYQNGIIGKVVRIDHRPEGKYDVGVLFITREEKNMTHIYPRVKFMHYDAGEQNTENGEEA